MSMRKLLVRMAVMCWQRVVSMAIVAFCAAAAVPSYADDPEDPVVDPVVKPDVWAEITYDDIPVDVTNRLGALIPLDAVAYVQTGLMGHFDAIRNIGAALPHDPNAVEWKNLVAGYPDAEFISNAGYWRNGHSFCFTGEGTSGCARLKSTLNTGSDIMVQLAVTVDYLKQHTGSGRYPIFFHDGPNELSVFFDNRSKQTQTLYLKADRHGAGSSNRPSLANWDGKYATIIVHTNQQLIAESASIAKTRTATPSISTFNCQFSWFSSYSTSSDNGEAIGDCHAVRIYSSELVPAELAWNRMLDEVRYRGAETNVNVAVVSSAAGVEANETAGRYMVNGHHVFTAPASVTANGCTYALEGYTLEVWDADKKGWGAAEVHVGESSFAYTNCIARAKVRLTWNWNMTSGTKSLDADAYPQNGLVLNFDGIRNAGFGVPHDLDATDWANLGSYGCAGFAEKTTLASANWHENSADGSWDSDGYRFRSRNYFAMKYLVDLGLESTAQIVADYDNAAAKPFFTGNGIRWPTFFGGIDAGNMFNFYVNIQSDNADKVYSYSLANSSYRPNTTNWDGRFINRTYDATTANKVTLTSSYGATWNSGSKTLPTGTSAGVHKLAIGTEGVDASANYSHIVNGKVCAVRLYDRVLSADEIAYNRAIDEARFFGRFANLDAMDAVLVRSESPDGKVRIDGEGAYIVRNASKTFTAPATFELGGKTYSCTGYRIETWNATASQWNVDSTGAGLSAVVSSTATGAANRRLTWFWSITQGLRTAADFTAFDYVQDGLVGNFDGISNHGADHLHNTYTRTWRNLVPDQPDAKFNTANGNWGGNGDAFEFTGNVHASLESPGIDVGGSNLSIQLATVVDCMDQPFVSGENTTPSSSATTATIRTSSSTTIQR
ncbi:MAG: hypothetical protein J6Z49_01200 [Kiritimatiellae bacterium]|nr:hypothetical protein [Kiritimatiellia bacterium]